MRRFFTDKIEKEITLGGEEHNHLANVLRSKTGDEVIVFCGDGYEYVCKIMEIAKKQTKLEVLTKTLSNKAPKTDITVFMGLTKGDKLDYLVQKFTELGISSVVPFTSKFCQVSAKNLNAERIQKQIISASKQCGRSELMKFETPLDFKKLVSELKNFEHVIFANEREQTAKINVSKIKPNQKIAIVVGSEGGFDADEIAEISLLKNVQSVTLGKRILRAETAGVALASVVCYEVGEWQ